MRFFDLVTDAHYEASQMEAVQYQQFEAAITKWEARTGLKVEREFSDGEVVLENGKKVTLYQGKEWKHFAMFLGSREAHEYRRENPLLMEQAIEEWRRMGVNADVQVEGEEELYDR